METFKGVLAMARRSSEESRDRGVGSELVAEETRGKKLAAKILASFLENKHMLVTHPTTIKRIVRVRRTEIGRGSGGVLVELDFTRNGFKDWRRISSAYRSRYVYSMVRIWAVYSTDIDGSCIERIQLYNHIECAKAHKQGRDFHYAKWIMTPDDMKR